MKDRVPVLLLAAFCLGAAEAQDDKGGWGEPIPFSTKAKESCSMVVSMQGEATKLRITCRSANKTYWCEYLGKPEACRTYNVNRRHYFIQIMWELRKLSNACEGRHQLKPQMCKRATDEAQMIFTTAGSKPVAQKPAKTPQERPPAQTKPEPPKTTTLRPDTVKPVQVKPAQVKPELPKPIQPKAKLAQAKPAPVLPSPVQPEQVKTAVKTNTPKKTLPRPSKTTTPARPTEATTKESAKAIAEDYCWESLQSICTVVIGWFHN
ncbi:fibroblast growth factor binding protein 2a [Brienomyrus brachyistius]|uniref:fibroblast growth factor binding protein 2a n=1 Tax=Brienomyrus brachyistius TaxID=42636 RepID=UPI0020B43990|nr:fibroblast growth factor binding protein 2a [Brienomyrus brachyistius]